MSCKGDWFRDELRKIVCAAVLFIVVIAIALAKCIHQGEWWKSIKVQRKSAEEMQVEASAITAGSLIVQLICCYVSLEANAYHYFTPGHHVDHNASILIGLAVMLLIASAVWARPTGKEKPCVGSFLYERSAL